MQIFKGILYPKMKMYLWHPQSNQDLDFFIGFLPQTMVLGDS